MFDDSTWIIGIVLAPLLYLCYWYRRPNNSPPGPRGVPVLGCIPFMGNLPHLKAYEWSKQYGPVLCVRIGLDDVIFLNDYDTITKVIVRKPMTCEH